jgi:GAF domain-containing protein
VLKVISRSTFDLQEVLDTLVESAARVCHADKGNIARVKDGGFKFAAFFGFPPDYKKYMAALPVNRVDRGSITGRTVLEGRTVHIPDVLADPEFTWFEAQKRGGYRTALGVPLLREGMPIGVFFLTRTTVYPFTQQQIELVTTFADQAVIAIENVRLFDDVQARTRELSEALEQQTATSDVLRIISSSPSELEPVFRALLANATRLCEASYGALWLCEVDGYRTAALHGPLPEAYLEQLRPGTVYHPDPEVSLVRATKTQRAVQVADLSATRPYLDRDPLYVAAVDIAGIRTLVSVPMLKGADVVGLDVDRTERAAAAHTAHLERQHEIARLLAEAQPVVERQGLQVRVQDEVRGTPCSHVLDHGLDQRAAHSFAALALDDVDVPDPGEMLLEPGGDEADHLAVLLGEEEAIRTERAFDLGPVRIPARVCPGRRSRAFGLPELPEPLNSFEVVVCAVTDRHVGGRRRKPVRR